MPDRKQFIVTHVAPADVVPGTVYRVTDFDRAKLNERNHLIIWGVGEHAHHGTLEISTPALWPPLSELECECFELPSKYWTTHYGAVDPATTHEYNPECPQHGEGVHHG